MGEKADNAKDLILPSWHCRQCNFTCKVVLVDWDKRKLYCAAYETYPDDSTKIITHKEYLHAESDQDAKIQFWNGRLTSEKARINLIGIAPVIGFFVMDDQGRKLEV
jgi:hypothetical protein